MLENETRVIENETRVMPKHMNHETNPATFTFRKILFVTWVELLLKGL